MIKTIRHGDELYVYYLGNGKASLIFKRWISRKIDMVMDRIPFTLINKKQTNEKGSL